MSTSPARAGTWFLTYSLPALATPLLLARVSHRVPPAVLVALGPLLIAASSLLLLAAYPARSWPALVPGFVVGGLGGIGNLVSSQVALAAAPPGRAGVASGITGTAKQAGIAAGVAVLGVPYRLGGLGAMLVTAACIAALGALPALLLALRLRTRRGEVSGERAERPGDLVA
jgi:predicted MFS family arabinose efflux permease